MSVAVADRTIERLLTEASLSLTRDRYEARLARRLASYFRRWAKGFPAAKLAADITARRRLREQEDPESAAYLDAVLRAWPEDDDLEELLYDAYLVTGSAAGRSALRAIGVGGPFSLRGERVLEALRTQAASQVTRIDDVSRATVRRILAAGIERGAHPTEIARDLRREFRSWSEPVPTEVEKFGVKRAERLAAKRALTRATTIARTETAWAWSSVTHDAYSRNGVTHRRWMAVQTDPNEVCNINEDAGDVPIDQPFPSGHDFPPAHPSCRCALAPARIPGNEPPAVLWRGE